MSPREPRPLPPPEPDTTGALGALLARVWP
jgi:hypothetical protein